MKLTIDGCPLEIYHSLAAASRDNDVSISAIWHCVNGLTKTSGGYKWEKIKKIKKSREKLAQLKKSPYI